MTQRHVITRYFSCVSGTCGGTLAATASPQNLSSPNYPQNYAHGLNCRWLIEAPSTPYPKQVLLQVHDVSIEAHAQCQYDYLELRDQPLVSGTHFIVYKFFFLCSLLVALLLEL